MVNFARGRFAKNSSTTARFLRGAPFVFMFGRVSRDGEAGRLEVVVLDDM